MSSSHSRTEDLDLSDPPESEGGRGDRRAARRERLRRRSRRRRRTAVVLVVCLGLVGAATWVGYGFLRPVVDGFLEEDDFAGPGSGSVQVQVNGGDSGRAIGTTLVEAGVVKTVDAFVDATSDEPRSGSIQPGTYELAQEMTASDALSRLLDPSARVSVRVTIPEGFEKSQVFERLAEASGLPAEDFEAAAQDPSIGLPDAAEGDVEGFLFPATYDFEPDVQALEMVTTLVARSVRALEEVGVPADRQREIVIKASLVEEEARDPDDFGRVARVLDNRLADGMRLQLDSTVNYATGNTEITTTAEDRASESPYNTYRFPGLPPGPVSSPGTAALQAALEPTPGDWMYFVTVNPDTGETRFAVTDTEHAENVELFRAWLREQDG